MRLSCTGWALGGLSAAAAVLLAPDVPSLAHQLIGPSFPDAALAGASLLVLALASWSLLVAAAVVLGASSRLVAAITPVALRRALLVGAAGALTIAPAHAEQRAAPDSSPHSVAGLSLPDRPEGASSRPPASAPLAGRDTADHVRVRPGDTLWAIARRSLPPGATTAEIASATATWHRTNREVIGDDPDLVVPDQLLAPPSAKDLP
ncbi:LysM peptidoglycan-binding domain-containing protein [Aeromicrobium endophyticum]|uniref:LysM peptidoglycan-binding domain-containing protein n=1 Tax=Aeromicrobium endophyticum TaxID=2292704 RepID=A0A371P850_9ACTN|nr:LysM domain-containing protein [Aeromicrobium endophyticum]REK72154.1 LysM peptidoglycan-binding domain-containing protein [Aeromicrobium endophyticum]